MSAKRHAVWGAIVGGCVALAFGIVLAMQFDAELELGYIASTIPICAALGAGFGWLWHAWFARR